MSFATVSIPLRARTTGTVIASQTLTVSTQSVSFTSFSVPDTDWVVFDVVTSPVRVRWDGTAPTSSVGHKLLAGQSYQFEVEMFNACKFIRDTSAGVDATIFASPLAAE
jgi:hypothetical protein